MLTALKNINLIILKWPMTKYTQGLNIAYRFLVVENGINKTVVVFIIPGITTVYVPKKIIIFESNDLVL